MNKLEINLAKKSVPSNREYKFRIYMKSQGK